MAYYIVKNSGETFANIDLYIEAISGGERTFMRDIARGKVKCREILGEAMYQIDRETEKSLMELSPTVQDIDSVLACFGKAPTFEWAKELYSEGTKNRILQVPPCEDIMKFRAFDFLKVRNFTWQNKYRLLEHTATLQVCGTKFIVLGAYIKSKDVNTQFIVLVRE